MGSTDDLVSRSILRSGFRRIRASSRTLICRMFIPLTLAVAAAPLDAQTLSADRNSLGSTLSADTIRDLPLSDNLFHLLETTQPTLITDRFLAGGLYAGQGARVGGFLTSWSQSLFRIGEIDVSDPSGNGFPLLLPGLAFWNAV